MKLNGFDRVWGWDEYYLSNGKDRYVIELRIEEHWYKNGQPHTPTKEEQEFFDSLFYCE